MPVYEYEAQDRSGQLQRGTLFAASVGDAIKRLQEQGLVVLRMQECPLKVPSLLFRTSARPMAVFFRHLYNSYRAGIPLSEALTIFANTERSPLSSVASYAAQRVAKGVPLSQALRETPFPFPVFVLPLLEVGERGGQLERIFGYLADHFDREAQFEQEMKRGTIFARAYMGFGVFGMLLVLSIASSLGVEMPLVASIRGALKGILVLVGAWLVWRLLSMTRWTAPYTDFVLLHFPVLSIPWRRLMAARFARTLALLYSAGVSPHTSLELAAQATGSPFLLSAARRLSNQLQRGAKFTEVISQMPFLPPLVLQMLATGEKSGNLDESLYKAAEFLENEAQTAMKSYPIVAGFALYGFMLLLLVYLVFQGLGAIVSFYRSLP